MAHKPHLPPRARLALGLSLAGILSLHLLPCVAADSAPETDADLSPEPAAVAWADAARGRTPRARPALLEPPSRVEVDRQAASEDAAPGQALAGASLGVAGTSYRWWLQRGRADLGVGLGSLGYVTAPAGAPGEPLRVAGTVTTLTFGLRYRPTDSSVVYADALRARRFAATGADAYQAKVGVEWARRESPLRLDGGSLGLHLDSGLRMSLRLRKGKLGVYVRSSF